MQQVGEVVAIRGTVTAVSGSDVHELSIGSPIYADDVITTESASNVEIRFADDTVLSQGPDSEMSVDEYVFDAGDPDASEMFFQMAKGTFRMVTGKIAEGNPEAVAVESPLAVIGIRGTTTVHRIFADGTENHGAEDLTGDHVLVMTDAFGNTQLVTFDEGIVDFKPGEPMALVRRFTPQEIEEFRSIVPFTSLGEPADYQDEETEGEDEGAGDEQARQDGEQAGENPEEEVAENDESTVEIMGEHNAEMLWGGAEVLQSPEPIILVNADPWSEYTGPFGEGDEQLDEPAGLSALEDLRGDDDAEEELGEESVDESPKLPDAFYEHLEDFVFGGDGDNLLQGGSDEDGIFGYGGNDTLVGGHDDDYLEGGKGDDYLEGYFMSQNSPLDSWGETRDWDAAGYWFADGSVIVNLELGRAWGADGHDTLVNIYEAVGSDYCDTLIGMTSHYNEFMPRDGNDYIDGNSRENGVSFADASEGVYVDLDQQRAYGSGGDDTLVNITDIFGGDYDDTIYGLSNPDAFHRYEGGMGDDYIEGRGSAAHRVEYVHADGSVFVDLAGGRAYGADGDDTLVNIQRVKASDYDDTLLGSSDDQNVFRGMEGDDYIDGKSGTRDRVEYNSADGSVTVDLETGRSSGADGNDTLLGIEHIRGSEYDDSLLGDGNDNVIDGRTGDDYIDGRGGYDYADYWSGWDGTSVVVDLSTGRSSGYFGNDTLVGIEGVYGSDAGDTIIGDSANNTISGYDGDDSIQGGAGDDYLLGDDGDDTIYGGQGDDYMLGDDNGSDVYYYDSLADVNNGDRYQDFEHGVDKFLFNSSNFYDGALFVNKASGYNGANSGVGSTVFVYDQSADKLYYDADGDGGSSAQVIAEFVNAGSAPDGFDAGDIDFT